MKCDKVNVMSYWEYMVMIPYNYLKVKLMYKFIGFNNLFMQSLNL